MRAMNCKQFSIYFGCIILSVFSGCSLKSNNDPAPSAPAAGLAFFHAAPASPSMEVIFDGTTVNSSTSFSYNIFSGYLSVTPGSHNVRFATVTDHSTQLDTTLSVD